MSASASPDELLNRARAGSTEQLGRLLEIYRHYLRLLARIEIGRNLQAKLDASDLVQDTLLEAHRNFPKFRGVERSAVRLLAAADHGGQPGQSPAPLPRHPRPRRPPGTGAGRPPGSVVAALGPGAGRPRSSPSQQASRREQAVLLADALEQLPEDYREVIMLRHLEGLTFPEVSRRMGRSLDSVEKLWVRGLARLRQVMGDDAMSHDSRTRSAAGRPLGRRIREPATTRSPTIRG